MSNKSLLIMQYCQMNKESSVDLYVRYKANKEKARRESILKSKGGIIKKEICERHILNNVKGVNANIINKIKYINARNSRKIEKYIMHNVSSVMPHYC